MQFSLFTWSYYQYRFSLLCSLKVFHISFSFSYISCSSSLYFFFVNAMHLKNLGKNKKSILSFFFKVKYMPKAKYMRKQADINMSMRAILVDWLVEVGEEYKLLPQTLYLTVNYIDRFLSIMSVLRGKLQLVGTACMLLASKFEEIYPPEVSEFVYITDDTYTSKQVNHSLSIRPSEGNLGRSRDRKRRPDTKAVLSCVQHPKSGCFFDWLIEQ